MLTIDYVSVFSYFYTFYILYLIQLKNPIFIVFTERITNNKDSRNETITDEVKKEATRRHKAREFIRNFGSHVPFGVQTLGGVFIRTMKISTEEANSLSTLYSTAAARLTATNSEASKTTTTATARKGFLGLGGR